MPAHRSRSISGWLISSPGRGLGKKKTTSVDRFVGESHRAEQALDDAGLRPSSEVVLVQSETLTSADPEFRTAVDQVVRGSQSFTTSRR